MRIYTKVVIHIETGNVLESESYDYNGPIAECKGGSSTKVNYVQSPEARQALSAYMPALQKMGAAAEAGEQLWNTSNIPTSSLSYYPTTPYSVGGVEELLYQPGMLSEDVITGLQSPYLDYLGQAVEQFGGGYGSARGGISGAGQTVLNKALEYTAPNLALATQQMVSPALSQAYQARIGAEQAGYGGQLAQAAAATNLAGQQYSAEQAAMAAPYQALPSIVSGAMPTPVQSSGGKK